jgi:D-alanyl-D-alanine carboxypeptidase
MMRRMAVDATVLSNALRETARDHGPGVYGLVTEDGKVVFEGSEGVADLGSGRPINATDRYRISSVTKVYTATVVLQLMSEGVLALGDSVERWLPAMVPGGADVTIEMLLRLRSGIPDSTTPLFGDPPNPAILQEYWPPERVVALAIADAGNRLAPDAQYRYSNTDYLLLGLIIEAATGHRPTRRRATVAADLPASAPDPDHAPDGRYIRGPHAEGHIRFSADEPYTEFTTMTPSESFTAGAIVATASDVAAFLDGMLGGTLLTPDALALMLDATEVLDDICRRGLGIVRCDFGTGNIAYGHHGGVFGYTNIARRTDSGRAVVLWQNGIDMHEILADDAPFV